MTNVDSNNIVVTNGYTSNSNGNEGFLDSQQFGSSGNAESLELEQHHHSSHHHSSTSSMLLVYSSTQLEVTFLISTQSDLPTNSELTTHSMTTRLKSGAISRRNYATLLA